MMDKTIPYIGVLMTCQDADSYPRCPLPSGYTMRLYQPGMEQEWAALQVSVEHMDTLEDALSRFASELAVDPETLKERGVFVYSPDGKLAASAILWYGNHFGRTLARVHWVAVTPEEQGKGLCKALMTILMDLYHQHNLTGGLYLTSQTWSYKALNIYRRFGFKPYYGPKPSGWKTESDDFEQDAREAWNLIEQKLKAYRQQL